MAAKENEGTAEGDKGGSGLCSKQTFTFLRLTQRNKQGRLYAS